MKFDFSANEALVLGGQVSADFPISFHVNQTDAETNQNPITTPNAYTNTLQNETIWVRIADKTQTCFEIISFNIAVNKWDEYYKNKTSELETSIQEKEEYNQTQKADYLYIKNLDQNQNLMVFDMLGKKLFEQAFELNSPIDITSLDKGLYLLKTENNLTTRFIKN